MMALVNIEETKSVRSRIPKGRRGIAAEPRTPLGVQPIRNLSGSFREELKRACSRRFRGLQGHLSVERVTQTVDPRAVAREPWAVSPSHDRQEDDREDQGAGCRANDWYIPLARDQIEPVQRDEQTDEERGPACERSNRDDSLGVRVCFVLSIGRLA